MKKHNIRYMPVAEEDLNEIVDYLLEYGVSTANKFVDDLEKLEERLSMFPKSAPLVRDKRLRDKGYRVAVIGSYLLFYLTNETDTYVMRVIHGKQDYANML